MEPASNWPRRTVLKGFGIAAVTTGLAATSIELPSASPNADGRPLEATPSTVDYVVYAGRDNLYLTDEATPGDSVTDPFLDFGFPALPVAAGTDAEGQIFDSTEARIGPDAETIWYALEFGGIRSPYRLLHQGAGTYHSTGAVVEFEWTDDERFPLPFFAVGQSYRVIVRDVVQLYEPGGAFDWSATRTDFFDTESGTHVVSMLIIVWDEDGAENQQSLDRGNAGRAIDHQDGPAPPMFPTDATPTVDGSSIAETVDRLIDAGISTDGAV